MFVSPVIGVDPSPYIHIYPISSLIVNIRSSILSFIYGIVEKIKDDYIFHILTYIQYHPSPMAGELLKDSAIAAVAAQDSTSAIGREVAPAAGQPKRSQNP